MAKIIDWLLITDNIKLVSFILLLILIYLLGYLIEYNEGKRIKYKYKCKKGKYIIKRRYKILGFNIWFIVLKTSNYKSFLNYIKKYKVKS